MLTPAIGQAQAKYVPYSYGGGYNVIYQENEFEIEEGRLDDNGNIVHPSRCKPAAESVMSYDVDEECETAPPWCCNPYSPDPNGCWNYWPNISHRDWYICTHHTKYFIRHLRGCGKH
ncbi:MAG: hypothetical protein Q8K75_01740 [Chlamydiales bacterium]|nr:hypothetical protein [Chlamydiales bacterium]